MSTTIENPTIRPGLLHRAGVRLGLLAAAGAVTATSFGAAAGPAIAERINNTDSNSLIRDYAKPGLVENAGSDGLPTGSVVETVPDGVKTPEEFVDTLDIKPAMEDDAVTVVSKEFGGPGNMHAGDQAALPADIYQNK